MLAIKFQRIGKKRKPSYRVVVAEKRSKLGGPPVEDLGFYTPATKRTSLNKERAGYWLSVGARPTVTVHNLFVREGILSGAKIAVKIRIKKSEAVASVSPAPAEVPPAAKPAGAEPA